MWRGILDCSNAAELIRSVGDYMEHYNNVRLHGAIGYVTPKDMLEGGQARVHADRERKLEHARRLRGEKRLQARREYSLREEKLHATIVHTR